MWSSFPTLNVHNPGPLESVLHLIDERFGPLCDLAPRLLVDGERPWWLYTCNIARVPAGAWFKPYPSQAAGTAIEGEVALKRCLGEAVERFSGLYSVYYDTPEVLSLG